jgi:hypothetical protein
LFKDIRITCTNIQQHKSILFSILQTHADKLTVLIDNTANYTQLFKWTSRHTNSSIKNVPALEIFLLNLIPNDLVATFSAHISSQSVIKKLLLPFVYNLQMDIYNTIWKTRNDLFKQWKNANNISSKSFKNYKRTSHNTSINSQNRSRARRDAYWTYSNPFNDYRNSYLPSDLWIRFTSSNFLHNGPWCNALDFNVNDIDFFSYFFFFILFWLFYL